MRTVRIKNQITREGRFVRQDSSRGRFAILQVRFEPISSPDLEVIWGIPVGSIPQECADAAISAVREIFLPTGPYGHLAFVSTRITFIGAEYHPKNSNPIDYKSAAAIAVREAIHAEGEYSGA